MSEDYSILLGGQIHIESIVEIVEQFIGHHFDKSLEAEWDLYNTQAVGFSIVIYEVVDFENDQGIDFSQYAVLISIKALPCMKNNKYHEEFITLLSKVIASVLSSRLEIKYLIVKNLQQIICSSE